MIQGILNKLEAFILKCNPYFTNSYADASTSPYTGYILSGELPVFPNDTLGNYFYIRIPNLSRFNYNSIFAQEEGINPAGIDLPCTVVACVRSADPEILLENLITTISAYQTDIIKLTNCTTQRDIICVQELARLSKEEISTAISKIDKDYTIAMISFTISAPYTIQRLGCLKSPII